MQWKKDACDMRPISLDVSHMMADMLGMQYGIQEADILRLVPQAQKAQAAVEAGRGQNMLGWMELPYNQEEVLVHLDAVAAHVRGAYDNFVVLGIGGSALGPIAVHQALNHLRYNDLPKAMRGGPRLFVEDNVDPERLATLLDVIDLSKTCFNVITKSGATAETISQYMIISDLLRREIGEGWQKHIIATTDQQTGNLCKLAQQEGFTTFIIPNGVGGRFSELCPVGLLAAAVCGIDVRMLLSGAAAMDARCKTGDIWQNPALMEAALMYTAMQEKGMGIQVMMPYADSLKSIADWFCQLWGESLGKNVTRKGKAVNYGQTPVKSLGVTDQHSQLQLYSEGPYDKVITFLRVENFRAHTAIPCGNADFPDIAFLGGMSHNKLIEAERIGTEYALYRAGRMSQTITLPTVNEYTIGQLLYFFEMTTAYMGELLDIDAFNQPGVEESKLATYAELGSEKKTAVKKREEMSERPARNKKHIL